MSDGPRMGWYDSSIVRGGQDFKVQGDLREYLRDYFMELKVSDGLRKSRGNIGQEWSGWFQLKFKGSTST